MYGVHHILPRLLSKGYERIESVHFQSELTGVGRVFVLDLVMLPREGSDGDIRIVGRLR